MSLRGHKLRQIGPSFLRRRRMPPTYAQRRYDRSPFRSCAGCNEMVPQSAAQVRQGENTSVNADHEALVSRFHPYSVRSHASGHIRRPAARRRSAFRTPLPNQVWAPAPECTAWHLGAGPLARASPRGDPANPGIQTTETRHVSESHYAHRLPRQ